MNRAQQAKVVKTLSTFLAPVVAEGLVEKLIAHGWVIQRAETVRRAYDRVSLAEHRVGWAEQDQEHTRQWAITALQEQRRLGERCSFLYGVALAHGATKEELNQ